MIKLRQWQTEATYKALQWLLEKRRDRHFLINAAPGAGKTYCAIAIADELLARGEIDRVVVIAPRTEVVGQWAAAYQRATN
jgi:superfamily II DNA or RNA helicase